MRSSCDHAEWRRPRSRPPSSATVRRKGSDDEVRDLQDRGNAVRRLRPNDQGLDRKRAGRADRRRLPGFIEPCSIGSTLIFVKHLESKDAASKLAQVAVFAATRALFIGLLGVL